MGPNEHDIDDENEGTPKARHILARGARGVQTTRAQRLLQSARLAQDEGDLDRAIDLLEQAARKGGSVDAELRVLRKKLARARSEAAVRRVQELLPSREGLLAWIELTVAERRQIKSPQLSRLEQIGLATRWREPEAAVDALIALESSGTLQERRSRLVRHRQFLARTPFRGEIDELDARIRAEERAQREASRFELSLEDLVLGWEEGLDAAGLAEELGCTEAQVLAARRRHGLVEPPSTRKERLELLLRCGWTQKDAEEQVGD
jgi:hypothetical protein